MKNEKLIKNMVELRIKLSCLCDGFNSEQSNKKRMLTMDKKVLAVLDETKNCAPNVLIETLGIAKSNLALLCKSMIKDGLITQTKTDGDKRHIFYNITEEGRVKLKEFYFNLESDALKNVDANNLNKLESNVQEIINFLNNIKK